MRILMRTSLFCLLLTSGLFAADESAWKQYHDAAKEAEKAGRLTDAERFYKLAIQEAERFGSEDKRLSNSLQGLACVYDSLARVYKLFSKKQAQIVAWQGFRRRDSV